MSDPKTRMVELEAMTGENLDLQGKADIVLDSNVALLLHSCHDLMAVYERLHKEIGEAARTHRDVTHRLSRYSDALHFAIRCHEEKTRTVILPSEVVRILEERVPPDAKTFERDFVGFVIYCIKDHVLKREEVGIEPKTPKEKEAADDFLLDVAEANGLPLITDEGNTPDGLTEGRGKKPNLRGKAKARNVKVYTPGEWWRRPGFDPTIAGPAFAQRLNSAAKEYGSSHAATPEQREAFRALTWVFGVMVNGRIPEDD